MDSAAHLTLWAASEASALDPLDWLQYGVLGLVVIALLTGRLHPTGRVDDLKEALAQLRADKLAVEKQRDSLIETYEQKIIPVLIDVQRQVIPAAESMVTGVGALREERMAMEQRIRSLNADLAAITNAIERTSRETKKRSRTSDDD